MRHVFDRILYTDLTPKEVFENLINLNELNVVVELKLSESSIVLATKPFSYNGFGLYVQGDITHSSRTKIDLNVGVRYDFYLFNLIFGIALLAALFYEKALINELELPFEDRIPYVLFSFLLLMVFDVGFVMISWFSLKRHLLNQLKVEK